MPSDSHATPASYCLPSRTVPLDDSWDVIVVGGGPAGCTAAAASARQGSRTLLIEAAGALGGMGTLGLVPWFCGYDDGKEVIARGLAEHVRLALGDQAPSIDPELLKRIYDDLVTGNGAKVLFFSRLCAVEMTEEGNIDALLVSNKAGLSAFRAKVYVDCTGDGDLAAMAGAPFEKGDGVGNLQPATHCFTLTNVDPYDCWFNPQRPAGSAPSVHFFDPDSPVHKAMQSGRYPLIVDLHSCSTQIGPRTYGFNTGHVFDVDNTDPESVSMALIHGRKQAAQYREAFAEFHPAFTHAMLTATGALLGVRETRRILGDYLLTAADYLARRSFPDEICRNAYNIDVHSNAEEAQQISRKPLDEIHQWLEETTRPLSPGESYGIPYRCLLPRGLANVLVAGRCISTDRAVNGSIRIMACCLTTGEAAGIAAAMAATADGNVHTVDHTKLRASLREHGAYLP
ncbi:MAG: FAD-dependent oxidoreductase [Armatimonadota bacterium]